MTLAIRSKKSLGGSYCAGICKGRQSKPCCHGNRCCDKNGAHAGKLIKAIAQVGGGGGGRPNMAQAGGKNPAGIPDAIASVKDALSGMIK